MTTMALRVLRACLPAILVAPMAIAGAAEPSNSGLDRLADLSAERVVLADRVAASKRQSGKPVEDAAREADQLQRLGEQAAAHGVPREQVTAFFKAQIEANKLVQYRLLSAPPRGAGRGAANNAPIDLGPVRERLDVINAGLLDALAPALQETRGETCTTRTHDAQARAARRHRLDDLHRIALSRAFGDFCRASNAPSTP